MPLPSRSAAARRAVMSRLVVMPRLIAAGGWFRIGQGILGCVAAAGTVLALMPAALAAPHSVPHRAHYAMSLLKAQPDAAIAGVAGDMAVIFDRACDGWSVLQASRMEIDFDEAEPVVSDILFDSEESDDGTRFRFRYEERENGESVELAIAHLDRTSPDRPSKLRFANPPGVTESVPAGALLPTAHTERLLQAAEAGEAFIRAQVLTGSGHFFDECLEIISRLEDCDIFISQAAEEVLRMYGHKNPFSEDTQVFRDTTASAVPVAQFYRGVYHTLIMAPVSSNTVAKCVAGISDNLATNVFAQAGKCRVSCIYFACDTAPELRSKAPKGMVDVYPRRIDLDNVERLRNFEATEVVDSMAALEKAIMARRECLRKSSS